MPVKYISELARVKSGNKPGIPVYMVNLYQEVFILGYKNGELSYKKVMPTEQYLQKWVGVSGFNIGLNKNKTPNWRNTVNKKNIAEVIKDAKYWLPYEEWAIVPVF